MTTAYESGTVPEILLHHRLRIAREAAGLEQAELADLMGVGRNTISKAEKGHTEPRRVVLNAWALATGVPVSWLQTGQIAEIPHPDGPDGGDALCAIRDSNPEPAGLESDPDLAVADLHRRRRRRLVTPLTAEPFAVPA